jgi:Cu+-exporting ATPase
VTGETAETPGRHPAPRAFTTRESENDPRGGRAMGLDPVCKMEVNPAGAAAQSDYEGQTFYFCSTECKRTFDANPQQYIDETDRAQGRAHRAEQARPR